MNKIGVLVVNINNLDYTRGCIADLLKQTRPFDLTIIDQNSNEAGTKEYLNKIAKTYNFKVVFNNENIDLNRIWNSFYLNNKNKYLCFLNNDVRLPDNFIADTIDIFEREDDVGCVVHATNHPNYSRKINQLKYIVLDRKIKQGWDFTIRRSAYNIIPDELHVYCGDDYLFEMMYRSNLKTAFALSSPIIHYQGKSMKYLKEPPSDVKRYAKLGFKHNLRHCPEYSKIKPTFKNIN